MTRCFVACGSNISGSFGTPLETLRTVFEELPQYELMILNKSQLFSSLAFPDPRMPKYLNGCLEIEVKCEASEVLDRLKLIEIKMGRVPSTRWGSRVCDLDLLSFADRVCPSNKVFNRWYKMSLREQLIKIPTDLVLPHPRLQDRAFVLKPLLEFAPDWIHPVHELTVREMYDNLPKELKDSVISI